MQVLIVGDVHYELGSHHGVDESGAFKWLLRVVKSVRPEFLVGLGDWGHAWIKPQWDEITQHCTIFSIYGNHDKLELLRRVTNRDGGKALVQDGVTKTIGGLRFGFVNGIVSETKQMREGVPRKTAEEFLRAGSSLSGIDVLCTHESPVVPEYEGRIHQSPGTEAVDAVIRRLRPKMALSGHLSGPYTLSRVGETVSLRVDSSPSERHFATLEVPGGTLRIYHDHELVREVPGVT